ncbi:MAG: hypothetical protein ABII76_05295, partial [Pseudomonadota bacterium]
VLEQRIGRVHRHGQREPVQVFFLVAEDSFEQGLESTLGAKRALFDAALDSRSTESTVDAPASCLWVFRAATGMVVGDGLDATDSSDAAPEVDGAAAPDVAAMESPEAAAGRLASLLGPRLRRALSLPSGKLVALVDRVDDATRDAAAGEGFTVMDMGLAGQLAALGDDSPLAASTVLMERGADDTNHDGVRRAEHLVVARRKLAAARALQGAGAGAEAMAQAHASMIAFARSLAADDEAGLSPPRLLYEILVPRGDLSLEQVALIARAGELAAAYSDVAQPAPDAMVAAVIGDAVGLVGE